MYNQGVFLNDAVIQEKAHRLQCSLNLSAEPAARTTCTFSNGWLHAFKKRYNLKQYSCHGEAGDADVEGANAALPGLRQLTSQYCISNIFNADEFGLFYTAAPRKSIAPGQLRGKKKSKQRVTFLVCANVDGTEQVPPLMIGKAHRMVVLWEDGSGGFGHRLRQ